MQRYRTVHLEQIEHPRVAIMGKERRVPEIGRISEKRENA